MKLLYVMVAVLSGQAAAAQDTTYSNIYTADGYSAEQIYTASKTALVKVYNSAKDVIQSEDKSAGIIIGRGSYFTTEESKSNHMPKEVITEYRIGYIIKVSIKTGRYKLEISDFTVQEKSELYSTIAGTDQTAWSEPASIDEYLNAVNTSYSKGPRMVKDMGIRMKAMADSLTLDLKAKIPSLMDDIKKEIDKDLSQSNW